MRIRRTMSVYRGLALLEKAAPVISAMHDHKDDENMIVEAMVENPKAARALEKFMDWADENPGDMAVALQFIQKKNWEKVFNDE